MSRFMAAAWVGVLLACVPWLAGCSKDDLNQMVDKAKQAASTGQEKLSDAASKGLNTAKETVQLAGNIDLQLDPPVTTAACYVRFIRQGSGRPNVLQLRSYQSVDQEAFPSVFLHAQVAVGSPEELAGQVVSARVFVQTEQNGAVWYTKAGSPAELQINAIDGKLLTAELLSGSLHHSGNGVSVPLKGTLSGVLP